MHTALTLPERNFAINRPVRFELTCATGSGHLLVEYVGTITKHPSRHPAQPSPDYHAAKLETDWHRAHPRRNRRSGGTANRKEAETLGAKASEIRIARVTR